MKIRIGDKVRWVEGGDEGSVVAMTNDWCIFLAGKIEIAVPWEQIELVALPGDMTTLLHEKEIQ